jgi:hypothetical protein
MPKFKQFGISVVGLLVAAGAMASNFRVADQVYLPVAGKVGTFKTDVNISNLSSDSVTVTMALVQGANTQVAAPQNNFPSIVLGPNERREIIDFFPTALGIQSGLGQVLFNACKTGVDCTGTDQSGFRNISVESRIYSQDAAGNTSGQGFAGLPWYSYVSNNQANNGTNLDKAFVVGLRQTGGSGQAGTFRTNLGFTNASQFSTTTLTVKVFNAAGTQLGSATVTLGPLGQTQPSLAGLIPGATGAGLWMTVEQTSVTPTSEASNQAFGCTDGCPGFFTYASVIDNVTQDPTTLESQFQVPLTQAAINVIFPAGKVPSRAAKH